MASVDWTGIDTNGGLSTVFVGNATYWFSYGTLIGFYHPLTGKVLSVNYWGSATGRHLNQIDSDKSIRVKNNEFARLYEIIHRRQFPDSE